MNCATCQRMNLPGGVRCAYCGTAFPAAIDFDLGGQDTTRTQSQNVSGSEGSAKQSGRAAKTKGLAGTLAVLALKWKSLLSLLSLGKIALTLASMAVYMRIYAWRFGWALAAGFTICILIHELGHVVVGWRKGIKQTAPMFIPFLGAVIQVKSFPNDPTVESEMGAGGPVAGTIAGLVSLLIAHHTDSPAWFMIAFWALTINLLNLFPWEPLDGSHIAAAFSPQVWSGVLISLLLWVLKAPSIGVWLILIIGFLFRLGNGDDGRYMLAPPVVRIRMAVIYFTLCVVLGWGTQDAAKVLVQQGNSMRSAMSGQFAAAHRTQRQVAPAPQSDTDNVSAPADSQAAFAPSPTFVWAFRVLTCLLAALLWFFTAYLLVTASGQPFTARSLILPAAMCGALILLYTAIKLSHLNTIKGWTLLGAYFAATGAALIYAGYQAVHQNGRRVRPAPSALLARCLAWACAGALLVDYAANDLIVLGAAALFALLFYLRYPWMLVSMAGSLAESIGDHERSLALRRRALDLKPDSQAAAQLWADIARLNVLLDRGGPALEAFQARDAILTPPGSPAGASSPLSIQDLERRAAAFMLLDRYDEALACCERILQAPPDDPLSALRLLAVHSRLARIARFRGWYDEALAQTDWCLRGAPKQAKALLARLHAGRAEALVAQGQDETARAECDQALSYSRETYVQAWVAAIRTQIGLQARQFDAAERESARAVKLIPGHLEFRYWRGRALAAVGTGGEGKEILSGLAASFPNEHWGRLALVPIRQATDLATVSIGHAALDPTA